MCRLYTFDDVFLVVFFSRRRVQSNKKRETYIDIVQTMFYYRRQRAADYLQYREQLTKIDTIVRKFLQGFVSIEVCYF